MLLRIFNNFTVTTLLLPTALENVFNRHRSSAVALFGSAYGTRTRAPALRGPCPNRLDERAK
jgi:hypothetical protein